MLARFREMHAHIRRDQQVIKFIIVTMNHNKAEAIHDITLLDTKQNATTLNI